MLGKHDSLKKRLYNFAELELSSQSTHVFEGLLSCRCVLLTTIFVASCFGLMTSCGQNLDGVVALIVLDRRCEWLVVVCDTNNAHWNCSSLQFVKGKCLLRSQSS